MTIDWIKVYDELAAKNKDPRMMMGYQIDGIPLSWETINAMLYDIKKKLQLEHDLKFLDVGGGVGLCSKYCQIRDSCLVDTSVSMLQGSDLKNRLLSELSNLPFKNETFDRVLCYSVFHYLKDYEHAKKAIHEFLRVTKKNGLILIGDILKSTTKDTQHAYKPDWFRDNFANITILEQNILSKPTSKDRYDVLFSK